jgi:inhibitor of KinA
LSTKIWLVPVCYELDYGKDLENLAKTKGLGIEELIALHSSTTYRIHFFGFLPGFMYLNGLPEILHSARKAVPERAVPAGSVAIGGSQTGIYPRQSPGGWHIIGRTPLALFDAEKNPPVWASPGDSLRFVPIHESELEKLLKNPPLPVCL